MSISGLGDELPDDPKPARPHPAVVIQEALRQAADAAYPDDNAKPYQETLRALTAGEIVVTSVPVVTSGIGYTSYGGGALTVTDEAAAALRAEGLVVVNRDDLKAILEGKASPDQWMQLAAAIGVSR